MTKSSDLGPLSPEAEAIHSALARLLAAYNLPAEDQFWPTEKAASGAASDGVVR